MLISLISALGFEVANGLLDGQLEELERSRVASVLARHFKKPARLGELFAKSLGRAVDSLEVALAGPGWLASGQDKSFARGFEQQVLEPFVAQNRDLGDASTVRDDCLEELRLVRGAKVLEVEVREDVLANALHAASSAERSWNGFLHIREEGSEWLIARIEEALASDEGGSRSLVRLLRWNGQNLLLGLARDHFLRLVAHDSEAKVLLDALERRQARERLGSLEAAALEVKNVRVWHDAIARSFDDLLEKHRKLSAEVESNGRRLDELLREVKKLQHGRGVASTERLSPDALSKNVEKRELELAESLSRVARSVLERMPGRVAVRALDAAATTIAVAKPELAAELVEQALERAPKDARLRYKLYRIRVAQGKLVEAFTAYKTAIELDAHMAEFPPALFEPKAILGAGGFGVVFHAFDRQLRVDRTIKVLLCPRESRDRFLAEARAGALLEGVVRVLDFKCDDRERPYLVMEYFSGARDLAAHLAEKRLALDEALRIAREVAITLRAAHSKGIWHRDVKPENILVAPAVPPDPPRIKLCDFGIAHVPVAGKPITKKGEALYSPDYTAPEQKQNAAAADHRADVFSFGKTLYFLVTGEPAGDHYNVENLPPPLRPVFQKAIDKDPAKRFQSFDEVLAALPLARDLERVRIAEKQYSSAVKSVIADERVSDTERQFLVDLARDLAIVPARCRELESAVLDVAALSDARFASELRERLVVELAQPIAPPAAPSPKSTTGRQPSISERLPRLRVNERFTAFCSPAALKLFHAVATRHEVWQRDPFDVETLHAEAREAFSSLLAQASAKPGFDQGRFLVLRGASGAGKTHLLRAFRAMVHGRGSGYFAYLQLSGGAQDPYRYLLGHVIDSLDKPYDPPTVETTGFQRLSNALARPLPRKDLEQLQEGAFAPGELPRFVHQLADRVKAAFPSVALDTIRGLLCLQRNDPAVQDRVLSWLRCGQPSSLDREVLGDLAAPADPLAVVEQLAKAMWATETVPLVIAADQLEEAVRGKDPKAGYAQFEQFVTPLREVTDRVRSSIVVLACLDDVYSQARNVIGNSLRDRLEQHVPVALGDSLPEDAVIEVVSRRLERLCDMEGVPFHEDEPTYPIPDGELRQFAGMRARDIFENVRRFHAECVRLGALPAAGTFTALATGQPVIESAPPPPPSDASSGTSRTSPETLRKEKPREPQAPAPPATVLEDELAELWNQALAGFFEARPWEDEKQASLIAWTLEAVAEELEGWKIAASPSGRHIEVTVETPRKSEQLLVGLCNAGTGRGALKGQIAETGSQAKATHVPVVVRAADFPTSGLTHDALGELIKKKNARKVRILESAWREMGAFRAFRTTHGSRKLASWAKRDRPLSSLDTVREILALDALERAAAPVVPHVEPVVEKPVAEKKVAKPVEKVVEKPREKPPEPAVERTTLVLGKTDDRAAALVELAPGDLKKHAAFLGGSGSGKTTLALNVIEQLLERGIPAILLDRKGDLCSYATAGAWTEPLEDPERESDRRRLKKRVDVVVYTPGNAARPLSIQLLPEGFAELPEAEREEATKHAATLLATMLKIKDDEKKAILVRALAWLGVQEKRVELDHIIEALANEEDGLVAAASHLYDSKTFKSLARKLDSLKEGAGKLLAAQGEKLDVGALLGLGKHAVPGKTRLAVVSTKFLGDDSPTGNVQVWVAQFLAELARWSSKNPSTKLQAVLLADEADKYLPAGMSNPPTKEPMSNLLRRARSAGLGVLLATQSPGDFDYKCRENVSTWFCGKIKEDTALGKMRPLLSERAGVEGRLPSLRPGQFYVLRELGVTSLNAMRSLVAPLQVADDEILALAAKR